MRTEEDRVLIIWTSSWIYSTRMPIRLKLFDILKLTSKTSITELNKFLSFYTDNV